MVNLTWEDIGEHLDKGDLEEWLKEERAKDKARQLNEYADTPQTDYLVKTSQKSRDSHEVDTSQTDRDAYWKELFEAVVKGEMSDAEANQAWYEYINKQDSPQTDCPKREPTMEEISDQCVGVRCDISKKGASRWE